MQKALVILLASGTAITAAYTGSSRDALAAPGIVAADARRAEIGRLRAHFDSVDLELRSRDVGGLSAAQRANRERLIGWLREYRHEGRFPQNRYFAEPTPFFRDEDGALCAMGYLIERSGRSDIVDDVARSRNNAFIRELADDRRLIAWLDSVGLTVAEAARIQPQYDGPGFVPDAREDQVTPEFALGAVALGGTSLASTALNVVAPRRWSQVLGIVSGTVSVAVGVSRLDENDGTKKVAAATVSLGAVSLLASAISMMRVEREPQVAQRVNVAPALFTMAGRGSRPGVIVRARF